MIYLKRKLLISFILIWHIIFFTFRLFNSRRLWSRREGAFDFLKATYPGTITITVAASIFKIKMVPQSSLFPSGLWAEPPLQRPPGDHLPVPGQRPEQQML